MKKILIIIILSLIFTYLPIKFASASVNFNNIEAYEMLNGSAKLKWSTNLNTKAEIHYGLDQNNLDRFMGYSLYDRWHETVLTGLEKDKTYYYKIYAIEESGVTTESFIRNFSTKDMEDTIKPDFEDNEILQTTHDAVAFKWITNEETKATIYYGTDPDNLNKTKGYGTYAKLHIKFIYGLNSGDKYYFRIKAIDRDGNYKERTISTTIHTSGSSSLTISNIEPMSSDNDLISATRAMIKWKTNLISKGVIYYGTSSNRLNDRVYVSPDRELNHEAQLESLIPGTTYYYKVKAYQSLYNKSKTSDLMSFRTKSLDEEYETIYPIGTLVKGSGPEIYAIRENMEKIWIKNEIIFHKLDYRWSMVKNVSDEYLSMYRTTITVDNNNSDRQPTGTLLKYENDSTVYMMYYGKKRPFFTARALERRGYSWDDIIIIHPEKTYQTGDFIF